MKILKLSFLLGLNLVLVGCSSPSKEGKKTHSLSNVELDTGYQLPQGWIFEKVKYYADELGVPRQFVYDIGKNESDWRNPNDSTFIMPPLYVKNESSYGDCQMLTTTYRAYQKKLGLGPMTRENLLIACIHHMKYCYLIGDSSWKKARYIYARGRWREPYRWTSLERKFMSKMNFNEY